MCASPARAYRVRGLLTPEVCGVQSSRARIEAKRSRNRRDAGHRLAGVHLWSQLQSGRREAGRRPTRCRVDDARAARPAQAQTTGRAPRVSRAIPSRHVTASLRKRAITRGKLDNYLGRVDHRPAWSPARAGVPPRRALVSHARELLLARREVLNLEQARNQRSKFGIRQGRELQ